ncbi:MAG: DUF488 family protein [Candidatus Caldarchaeum sp.]
MLIKVRRVYEGVSRDDGFRILVDRLWPRGLSKNGAVIDLWLKEIAPTDSLRKWFGHSPERWPVFKDRYFRELDGKEQLVEAILEKEKTYGTVTLLFSAKDVEHNNAVALREYLLAHSQR